MRVARWPTALAVFLLTTVAAFVIGRYVVLRVLPTREWWVAEEHPVLAIDEDTRPGQRYIEKVLFSQLSAESKIALLSRFGSTQNEDCLKKAPENRSPEVPVLWESNQWAMIRHIEEVAKRLSPSRRRSDAVDRYPDLGKPLMELVTAALADDTHPVETHARAFVLFLAMVHVSSDKGSREDDPHFRSGRDPGRADLTNATPSLVRFLSSPDPRVRRMAAMTFAKIGMPRQFSVMSYRDPRDVSVFPTGELVARLSDPDWLVRRWAAEALAYVPPNERHIVTPALLKAFTGDPSDSIRTTSVRSVGVIGALSEWKENAGLNPDPRVVLIQFLATPPRQGTSERTSRSKHSHSKDSDLRLEAVLALGRMSPTPQVTAALIQIVRDTPVESQPNIVECAAAWVLTQRPLDEPAQAALLDCVRRLWAAELIPNYVNKWKDGGGEEACYTLCTMVTALLMGNHIQKRIPQSDLIRVLPATVYPKGYLRVAFSGYPFEGYTQRPLKSCEFPRDERLWMDVMGYRDTRLNPDWLQDLLERVGPPAKSDLPALKLLLDYDGAGVTTDATVIQLVRTEAARAILRDLIYLKADPTAREVLDAVAADPTAHAVLKSVAEAKAAKLPRDKK